jgi:hypothetical protein
MNRVKRYLLLTYIFCLTVGMHSAIDPHIAVSEPRNIQTIIALGFLGSLFSALFFFPIAFIVAKIIDKLRGPMILKTKSKPSKLKNYNNLWD